MIDVMYWNYSNNKKKIHMFRHIHVYICFDYSVMIPYNLYAPIIIRLCVRAPRSFAQCLHTSDRTTGHWYF